MDIGAFYAQLAAFFDDQFITILIATIGLFAIMFITWWTYRKLSRRNLFIHFIKTQHKQHPTGKDHFLYALKYFLLFPLLIFVGFLIIAFSLFLLIVPKTPEEEATTLFVAIVIVSTIRVSAYVNENLAEEVAKLTPIAMLAVILTHPQFAGIGITWTQITSFLLLIPGFLKYLLFTIILEAMLRGGTFIFGNLGRDDDRQDSHQDSAAQE